MTVVVWDGEVLATDCAATDGAAMWETTKAWYHNNNGRQEILSGAGPVQSILAMREWYKRGAIADGLPPSQLSPNWCHFIVVTASGLYRYEQGPHSIYHGFNLCAFGEGKDFALGAMEMEADAARAVEVCNKLSPYCGLGVSRYQLEIHRK